jgi:hypothetical protein
MFVINMGDTTIKNTGIHFNKLEYLVPKTYDKITSKCTKHIKVPFYEIQWLEAQNTFNDQGEA